MQKLLNIIEKGNNKLQQQPFKKENKVEERKGKPTSTIGITSPEHYWTTTKPPLWPHRMQMYLFSC